MTLHERGTPGRAGAARGIHDAIIGAMPGVGPGRNIAMGLALVCAALGACGDDEPPWHADAAEQARELALLENVRVVRMSREEFAAQAQEQAEGISDAYLRYYADTYGRLGYFDRDLDLRPVFAASRSDWVGATYSPIDEEITLVGDATDDTVVHEWVHALQDQHFDIEAYDVLETSDAFLARRAVVEGDAVLAQYRFLRQQDGSDLHTVDWVATMDVWRAFSDEQLTSAEYPVVFLDYVSFVYSYGLEYAAHNLLGVSYEGAGDAPPPPHDWAAQDTLFTSRPPDTTLQVLLLDLAGEAVAPETGLGLGAVPEGLAEPLEQVEWDSLGAWYVYLLFHPLEVAGQVPDARALAAAWNGDRADFLRDPDSEAMSVVWASAWASEDTAAAVADALWTLHGGAPAADGPEQSGVAADGEALWIEQRGDRVALVKNVAAGDAAILADAALASEAAASARRHPSLAAAIERLRSAQRRGARCSRVSHNVSSLDARRL